MHPRLPKLVPPDITRPVGNQIDKRIVTRRLESTVVAPEPHAVVNTFGLHGCSWPESIARLSAKYAF